MSEQLTIDGFDELERLLNKLADEAQNEILKDALEAGAEPIEKHARQLAPVYEGPPRDDVVPGAVWSSIQTIKGKISKGEVTVKVRATAINPKDGEGYAGVLEYRPGPGQRPFMRPAFDAEKGNSQSIIAAKMREGIERAAGG